MPDEIPRPAAEPTDLNTSIVPDFAEQLAIVAAFCPSWIGADGNPLTWLHFKLALAVITRENARAQLRMSGAVGSVQAGVSKETHEAWRARVSRQAGW